MTLLELLMVVVVISIMATLALPGNADTGASRLHQVELEIEAAVARARSEAAGSGRPHGVVFDLAGDRFAVVGADGKPLEDRLTRRDYVIEFDQPGQPEGIDIVAADFGRGGTAVVFDPDGLPEDGGSVTLRCLGAQLVVTVEEATGTVYSS